MASSGFIPKTMHLAAEQLALSRNQFQLDTLSSNVSGPGQTTTFNLPEGSLVDLRSLAIHATFTTSKVSSQISKLPEDIACMISRVEVMCNGRSVQATSDYNTIARILSLTSSSREDDLTMGRMLSHSYIVSSTDAETYSACIRGLKGFILDASARYLDTGLVGQVQIRITWAGREVLVFHSGSTPKTDVTVAADATACSYTVKDIQVVCDSVSFSNEDLYRSLLAERMESQGYVSVFFKDYHVFNLAGQTASALNLRANVSSSSIDMLYGVLRKSTYANGNLPSFELPSNAVVLGDTNVSPYFRFLSLDTAIDSTAVTNESDQNLRYQFSVGNVKHPQFQAKISNAIERLAYCTPTGNIMATSRTAFNQAAATFVCPLALLGEPVGVRSGYDSRGVSSQITWDISGLANAGAAVTATLVVEVTKELRVSQGRSVVVSD